MIRATIKMFSKPQTSNFEAIYQKVKSVSRSKQAMLHDARRKYMLERSPASKDALQEAKSWAIELDNRCKAILSGC